MTNLTLAECPKHGAYMAHQGACPVCDFSADALITALENFSSAIGSSLEEKFKDKWATTGKPMPESEYRFHPVRRWRFDFAFVDIKLAVELEGGTHSNGRHVRGAGYEADTEKYNAAIELGWQVLRYTKVNDENIAQIIRVLDKLGQKA